MKQIMKIRLESPDQAEVLALIAELDAYQHSLYPPESVYSMDMASVAEETLLFAVARDDQGNAVGCGGIVLYPAYGEVKRMYVRPENRGQSIARQILTELEQQALNAGCSKLKLETGPLHREALGLYASFGYQQRGPFGSYPDDPLSVFMQKHLSAA
ncbi:GCN5 family N-acetyltransferase [Undibacterium terreum]|uniref:GCN5 family N-acetyltransferase n=2 Tax=Undibacterium terreum TaxID=1224302 RepID=A0A916U679_9BURK|nr:GCN5 family N-acetyltransferase [Undibacterium terreum]